MSTASGLRELRQLASLYGVQTAYYGVDRRRRSSSAESLAAVLQGLGANITSPKDAPLALRERQQQLWRRVVEPVTVAWDGNVANLPLRLPRQAANNSLNCLLTLESGEEKGWKRSMADLSPSESASIEGIEYVVKSLPFPKNLPRGYHRFTLEIPGSVPAETLLISAPVRAYDPFDDGSGPSWGVFLPVYALHRQKSTSPCGDFSDLAALAKWVGILGGSIIATLPILSTFLDEPFEPSPYAPASRLLWNEFYIDLLRVPELERCPDARAVLDSDSFSRDMERLQQSPLVDYRRGMALKRKVLEKLARCCYDHLQDRLQPLTDFLRKHPLVEDYASFRATMEKRGAPWHSWPQRLRQGDLTERDYNEKAKLYHCYVQWLAHEQVRELSKNNGGQGASLYLDLPLGVHSDGYDVWRRPDLFARGFAVGAPPDSFFTRGQNWGFPPLHPEHLRLSGYDYFRDYLQHHMETAGLLRLDHVMGLHRLFWVPPGMEASRGAYVRYPAEEFYAILTLESHRHQAAIVGEDLGTVHQDVRPAMRRHGIYGMYVTYFEMSDNPHRALQPVPSNALASINTHDMPPFAAFWQGLDIGYRQELGHQSEDGAQLELEAREKAKKALLRYLQSHNLLGPGQDNPQAVLNAIWSWLGRSQAPMVLINLEDLWLETQPQNIPGTGPEQPNWQHKARYSLEEFSQMPQVVEVLREFNSLRKLAQQRR
jgi:4-alpha-glucanotransferase